MKWEEITMRRLVYRKTLMMTSSKRVRCSALARSGTQHEVGGSLLRVL